MATPKPRGRQTPRDSLVSEASTPLGDVTVTALRRLPSYLVTPSRHGVNTSPSEDRRTPRRAPGAPSTPYGLRAMQRRTANTPGRDRRKSGRVQRETTFDILKNLGKALAPTSQPIRSSPSEKPGAPPSDEEKGGEVDELDDEPEVERPRLSLPIEAEVEEEEEGSPHIRPPRLSLAIDEDEDFTLRSVEYPRRASEENDRTRLSMMSYGGGRISGNFEGLTRLDGEPEGDSAGVIQEEDDDAREDGDDTMVSQGAFDKGGETEDLGRFHFDFNFPSPKPPSVGEPVDEPMHEEEGFELTAPGVQPDLDVANPVSSDDVTGEFGLNINSSPRVARSESPRVVGGGLLDENHTETNEGQTRVSRHGITVPKLPTGVVRKLATRFARARAGSKTKINKDTLNVIEQASSWFFEQMSEDLAAYSKHAGRKTIDESDAMTLMRRQRHINNSATVFSLAQKHLPKELLQDMKLTMPS